MHDKDIIRDLAKRYADIAAAPRNDSLRRLWRDHLSLRHTRVPVIAVIGPWDAWVQDYLDKNLRCTDPFLRELESQLHVRLLTADFNDDTIFEPWLPCPAVEPVPWSHSWGLPFPAEHLETRGTAAKVLPALPDIHDLSQLRAPAHVYDEAATERKAAAWHDALDGILPFEVTRTPLGSFGADISSVVAKLRGIEQVMVDMLEEPEALHRLLAFMRNAVLANQAVGTAAGHWTLASHFNQIMTYAHELPAPAPNSGPVPTTQLWFHCAAQEFTGVSPAMHDEFLLQYQKPIMEQFGLILYGCCEDLSRKIDILRQVRNIRTIAISPMLDTAGLARCAEQIGTDYAMSWRPNPADCVCNSWNPERVEKNLRAGFEVTRGTHRHIDLKDIHTVQGDVSRIRKFCTLARRLSEEYE